MAGLPENDQYRNEYTEDFVSNWDDLINWEGREQGESEFFERLLKAYGVEHVADIACGTGYHSVKLAQHGFTVTATDGAETMVQQTRENAADKGAKLHDLRCVDWLNLNREFGDAAFDAIVCLGNAFTHLFDHEARRDALSAIYSVLKPGGLVIIDHRNYDSILDQGYSSKHRYYYTGHSVDVHPVQTSRRMVKFEYAFGDSGETHHLTLYPLKQNYMSYLLEDAGFMDVTRYGDFERPYDHYDPDFIQQVGFKPKKPIRHTGPADKLSLTQKFVAETKRYYDGAADQIYRDIWGENIHLGYFENKDEPLPTAMERSNRLMADNAGLDSNHRILEVACGYGALARYLAKTFGCRVLASNISERELAWAKELTDKAGLDDLVKYEYGDFHELSYGDDQFDQYWSQEAFLHAVDKAQVLSEAHRVIKPGGKLVFTDILVRGNTPDDIRERVYERVNAPEMWDATDYRQALENLGFEIQVEEDWSSNVAPTYAWVRGQLEKRRVEFEERIGRELVDRTSKALQFWVDRANEGYIGWLYVVAKK